MVDQTPRERLMELLEKGEFDVEQLAEFTDRPVRDVLDDLEHVRRSAGDRFVVVPPECRACEFVFDDRDRLDRPSRCPSCREERVDGPWFHVEPA